MAIIELILFIIILTEAIFMSSKPLVSIVIPCYNHEKFVKDTIQSVIDQTYLNIELIIIDDGSTDSSVSIIEEMIEQCEQRFVRFKFKNRSNKGLSATLNEAIIWCEGEYYSALASDDIIFKDKTQIQVELLSENKNIVAVHGGVILINDNNEEGDTWISETRVYSFKDIILHEHNLPAPTQMARLESIKKAGCYDPNIIIEDWYMLLKLSEFGDILYIDHFFAYYRQHDSNMSKNMLKIHQGRLEVIACFKNSKHYQKAFHNIKWINANEKYKDDQRYQLGYLQAAFLIKPLKVSNVFFKYFTRVIKNKLRAAFK